MKKLLVITLAALVATGASALEIFERHLTVDSNEHHSIFLYFHTAAQNQCEPDMAVLFIAEQFKPGYHFDPKTLHARVDRNEKRSLMLKTSAEDGRAFGWISGSQLANLISDMREGNVLRVKYRSRSGADAFLSFNLSGFAAGMDELVTRCKQRLAQSDEVRGYFE